jgi:hypothetical protein
MGKFTDYWDVGKWLTGVGATQDFNTWTISFPQGTQVTMNVMQKCQNATEVKQLLLAAYEDDCRAKMLVPKPIEPAPVELPELEDRSKLWHVQFSDGRRDLIVSPLCDTLLLEGVTYKIVDWEVQGLVGYALFERRIQSQFGAGPGLRGMGGSLGELELQRLKEVMANQAKMQEIKNLVEQSKKYGQQDMRKDHDFYQEKWKEQQRYMDTHK